MFQLLRFINDEHPNGLTALNNHLDCSCTIVAEIIESIKRKVDEDFAQRDFRAVEQHSQLAEEAHKLESIFKNVIEQLNLENLVEEKSPEMVEGSGLENRDDLRPGVAYTLREDFTYTKPSSFVFIGDRVPVNSWRDVLLKTLEMLMTLDENRFLKLEDDPAIRDRLRKHISTDLNELRKPCLVAGKIYVETNVSALAITKLIGIMLEKYGFDLTDFQIYLARGRVAARQF